MQEEREGTSLVVLLPTPSVVTAELAVRDVIIRGRRNEEIGRTE